MGTYIPVELPLLSRMQERVFYFGAEQLSRQSSGKRLDRLSVQISDSGVNVFADVAQIYDKPASGIPKSDLAEDVQTSLNLAGTALQAVPGTYRTAAAQDELDTVKQPKAITDVGGHFGENPTVESALQQLGGALILRTWTD